MVIENLTVRTATKGDLDVIVSLTRTRRRQLAQWAPVYFNPANNADRLHAEFLEYMIESEDFATSALVADRSVVGFFAEHKLADGARVWVDDLCVADESVWSSAIAVIDTEVAAPWVTCVPVGDELQAHAMLHRGKQVISSYWARPTHDIAPEAPPGFDPLDFDPSRAAVHTFGGQAFQPDLPGALVVGSDAGFAIGSPSASPPIYDPGGPTPVIDQIHGPDRAAVLGMALAAAKDRGDAQVVVACAQTDQALASIVKDAGFDRVVDLTGN